MAIALARAGRDDFVIFEKSDGISGTWHDNTYPGAACDIPSHLYSYSFAPNPNWRHAFARQSEIKAYIEDCAKRYGITGNVRLKTAIQHAYFDASMGLWVLHTQSGEQILARFVISATGQLNTPNIPPINGLESFKGQCFHSARWPKGLALAGKNVAIIGSAASAIQIVPAIANEVAQLCVFQRTPNYILPRRDRRYSNAYPAFWRRFPMLLRAKHALMAIARDAISFGAFKKGSLRAKLFGRFTLYGMRDIVHDPQLRKALTPDYPLGCKRILLSDDYYQTLLHGNVNLITDSIAHITPDGLHTKSGRDIPADIIVMATGFARAGFLPALKVTGLQGADLGARYETNFAAYRGTSYAGFPNFFTLLGPNTGLGHSSMIIIIEAQIGYILKAIQHTASGVMDVRLEAEKRYNIKINKDLQGMVWAAGCSSWYKREDGTIPTLWPGTTAGFRKLMARTNFEDYRFIGD